MNNAYAEVFATVLGENQIKINEPMSRHTTFGIGGPADCFLIPKTAEELCIVTRLAHKYGMPVFVLGGERISLCGTRASGVWWFSPAGSRKSNRTGTF